MLKLLLIVSMLLILLTGHNCFGQAKDQRVLGVVLDDSTKMPVAGALVVTVERKYASKTNANGFFVLALPTRSPMAVAVEVLGYETAHILVRAGQVNDTLRIYVNRLNQKLDEVIVRGQKPSIEVGVDHITVDPSLYHGSTMATAYNLLKLIPGVRIDADGTLKLRGDSNLRVYIDGKPTLLSGKDLADWLQTQPLNTIKNVQIFSAANARLEADNTGGVININLQKVRLDGYQGNVGFGLGTQFNHSASANVTVKKKHVVSSARIGLYTHPNGGTIYSTRAGNDQNGVPYYLTEQGSRRAHDYTLSVGYNVTWEVDTTLSVSAKLGYTNYHINSTDDLFYTSQSNSPALTEQFRLIQGRIAANNGLTASLNLDKAWSSSNSGSLSLLLGRNTDKIDNTFAQDATVPTTDNYQDQRNEVAIQAQGMHSIPALGRLEAGIRGVVRTNQANYVNQSAGGLPNLADRLDYNQRTLALYAQHSVPYKKLEIQYGLRAEYYAAHLTSAAVPDYQQTYYNLFPSASVLYNLNDAQTLKLAYFRKTTRPGITYLNVFQDRRNPKDFVVGNSALVPEFKTGVELTYNFSGKKVYLTSTLYTAAVRDAIVSYVLPNTGNVVNTTYGNVGRETSVGLDTNTSYSLGKFTLNSQVTVEYYAARNQALGFGNQGLRVSSSTQVGYKANAGWYVEAAGDLETRRILLNGTQSGWNYISLTIEKSFADKFLCRFLMRDIFNTSNFVTQYTDFFDYSYQYRPQIQAFIISFTYKFGKNFSYKRAQDGLNLDDVKEKSVK